MVPALLGLGAIALGLIFSGCTPTRSEAKSPVAKEPLPGNKREQVEVGDDYATEMVSAAKKAREGNAGRFRISTFFASDCNACAAQSAAVTEVQAQRGYVDLVTYTLNAAAAPMVKQSIPTMIIQYSDCRDAVVVSEAMDTDALAALMNSVQQDCEHHNSPRFSSHLAPLGL